MSFLWKAAVLVGSVAAAAPAQAVTVTIDAIGTGTAVFNNSAGNAGFQIVTALSGVSYARPTFAYTVDGVSHTGTFSFNLNGPSFTSTARDTMRTTSGGLSFDLAPGTLQNTSQLDKLYGSIGVATLSGLRSQQATLTFEDVTWNPISNTNAYDAAFAEAFLAAFSALPLIVTTDTSFLSATNQPNRLRPFTISGAPAPAVPEPATWALMIAGFGLAGAALRRGRRIAYA